MPPVILRVFSLHAPEVECIGKGKAQKRYEFAVKASVATTLKHSKGGQFIVHARTLPGKPYDGHTLGVIIPEIERLVGASLDRIVADRGYRGHNAPVTHRFKVYISVGDSQKTHRWIPARIVTTMVPSTCGALSTNHPQEMREET